MLSQGTYRDSLDTTAPKFSTDTEQILIYARIVAAVDSAALWDSKPIPVVSSRAGEP